MGDDKYENESLIKFGWPEDVWFHVDEYSSAHVYVRLPSGVDITTIPQQVLDECCQLTKGNSIEGSKRPTVDIVYTPWSNLWKDDATMDTGTIGFKDVSKVLKIRHVSRDRELLNALEKTRKQVHPDLEAARLKRDREELLRLKKERKAAAKAREEQAQTERERYRTKHYLDLNAREGVTNEAIGDGTIQSCKKIEDDFM